MNINLTPEQIKIIKASLVGSVQRAAEKAELALKKGFHDAQEENSYYVRLGEDCQALIAAIDAQTNEPDEEDEDKCPECGEDYGFCQCGD